jgi:tripartite ATP-independent transporter DctP family solute receptor
VGRGKAWLAGAVTVADSEEGGISEMTQMTRRGVLKTGAAAGVFLAAPFYARTAGAAEIVYKFGHGFPLTHPFHIFLEQAVKKVAERSDGKMEIQIFGNNQLGGDTQMISQVRANAIQFFQGGGIIQSVLIPEASLSGIGFAFDSYDKVWAALDGDVGAYIRGGFEKVGLHAFEKMWDNGFRQISSSKGAIETPDDLAGFKIRVPAGQLYVAVFESLGAAPTSINLAEVYSALQTKVVDGQENPLVVFNTAKFFEVQTNVSMTNHIWDGVWLYANGDAWQALSPDLQEIVAGSFNETADGQRAEIAKQNSSLQADLEAKGVAFNSPDIEPFRQKLRDSGFYKEWSEKYSPEGWSALEKYVGQLV